MFTWQTLKSIGNNRVVKSMYFWVMFVPVAAKFLALVESPLDVTMFGAEIKLELSLPFSWIAFFFAAVVISAGLLLFHIFAPKLVRDHASYTHFKNDGKSQYQLKAYGEEVGFGLDDFDRAKQAADKDGYDEAVVKQMYWITVEKAESFRTLVKLLISFLYIAGFLMLGWVLIENILFVLSQI